MDTSTATPTTPTSTAPLAAVASDLADDIALIRRVAASIKAGGLSAATAQIPAVVAEVEANVRDVRAALPLVKAGYKTTEFWVAVGGVFVPVIGSNLLGHPLPFDVAGVLGGLAGVYAAVRALTKSNAAK